MIAQVYFWIFSVVALACGLGVVFSRHPIHGALSLIGTMVSLAGIYSLIDSPFLATIQILVYAGAIIMLLVFVIMVLNSAKDDSIPRWDSLGWAALVPGVAMGALLLRVLQAVVVRPAEQGGEPAVRGTVDNISQVLFADRFGAWSFLFLVVGLLLLTAIVGAVLLAKRRLESSTTAETHTSGGH